MISGSIDVLAVAFAVAAVIVVPVPVAAAAAPARLDTYLVRMVNRMERKMEFDCDEWPDDFELRANGGDMNVTYETADRPGYDYLTPRVSCIWS
ncbi:Os08g0343400 [Oryza sativa Japonica Group]|nr:Os08g0343400 [Oryza sativa Japonica Group]